MTERINLDKYDLIQAKSTSSKGNQQKWLIGSQWYKADHMGYEALCEVVISKLLKLTNVSDFVSYEPVKIEFSERVMNGCCSENFKHKDESIITLERLARQWLAKSITTELLNYPSAEEKIMFTVDFVESVTHMKDIGKYFSMMLTLDAFFLNEDRHTHNIAFILNDITGKYKLCPYFDFGLSLLADTTEDYPLDEDVLTLIRKVKSKPFSSDFDEQADAAQKLYGPQLELSFTRHDVENVLDSISEYYDQSIIERVRIILFEQMRRYQYLFKKQCSRQ